MRRALVVVLAIVCAVAASAAAAEADGLTPGAPGIGDPYFPLDGNGGYDVKHYLLDLRYQPQTDRLAGVATIRARATQGLSRFNLDFDGLRVRGIEVDGLPAAWTRTGGELTVTPPTGLPRGSVFTVAVSYAGVPKTLGDPPEPRSQLGFMHTDDGMVVVGQLHAAPTWFPVNDHPRDKAAYTFKLTVPTGLEAVANGMLRGQRADGDRTTWTWDVDEPMASYLTAAAVGEFDLHAHSADGISYLDAIDPDLFTPTARPHSGSQFAISQRGDLAYKRLARTIDVPASGGQMSFWVLRAAEPADYLFVEAHPVGSDNWTTLPDVNGHTRARNFSCPYWLQFHPFLEHYETDQGDGTCAAQGTTGKWRGAGGSSDGYEQWVVDLSRYAGRQIQLSISYATDDIVNFDGMFVDDIVVPGGQGSTSFEDDGDTFDGWTVPGPPAGSGPNEDDWSVGGVDDAPPSVGKVAATALEREPEIVRFLAGVYGPYPFHDGGGIVDDTDAFAFALETQTRPVFSTLFFDHPLIPPDVVVVHELAHQWVGDSVTPARWQDVWLNEGFATYSEWLWREHEGRETADETYESVIARPADDPFWSVVVADPGVDALFDSAIYARGAATLHALRREIGDRDFFELLRRWTSTHAGGNVTTAQFVALAERVSGQDLGAFFDAWLFSAEKPPVP